MTVPAAKKPFALLRPAATCMRRLKLPTKMLVMGAMLAMPLATLTTLALHDRHHAADVANAEREGAHVVAALLHVAAPLQAHRGQTNAAMAGDDAARAALPATAGKLDEALKAADAMMALHPDWGLGAMWQPLHAAIAGTAAGQLQGGAPEVFAEHTRQVTDLEATILRVAESSGLLLDPEAPSYFLMDLAATRTLPWTETTGLIRGQGAGLLARGSATPQETATLLGRIGALQAQVHAVRQKVEALRRTGEAVPPGFENAVQQATDFAATARQAFHDGTPRGNAQTYFAAGTSAISAIHDFSAQVNGRLIGILEERAAGAQRNFVLVAVATGLGVLAVLYAAYGFYAGTLRALRTVIAAAQAGAQGDLTVDARVGGRDEFTTLGDQIDSMIRQLASLVAGIRENAQTVASTGRQISGSSQQMSERATQQAADVEESAATLEQVANAVRSTADQAQHADAMVTAIRDASARGIARMGEAVVTIEGIESTSHRVTEIVTVIDGIAFQTNILALNAAVEAARAGESGRGFAVVAGEVRNLAQRSSKAAQEIRGLIGASTAQVSEGVGEIRTVRETLDALVGQVESVGSEIRSLNQLAREQTHAVDLVSRAVSDIGQAITANAAAAQEGSGAAMLLEERAEGLLQLVQRLRTSRA